MKRWWSTPHRQAFTLVELMVVIAVIAILATIVMVSYNGAQRHAVQTVMESDLSNASDAMELAKFNGGEYPSTLPDDITPSKGITLTLADQLPYYEGLDAVQQGVLFQTECSKLISEGYGTGTNIDGGTEQYVTACNVYNYNAMQINGWNAHDFNVPLNTSDLHSWYDANISYDSYRPNHKAVVLEFADKLVADYTAMGGTFPITSFWDSWANGSNGGVLKQSLSDPVSDGGDKFCIEAHSDRFADMVWHITQDTKQTSGPCGT